MQFCYHWPFLSVSALTGWFGCVVISLDFCTVYHTQFPSFPTVRASNGFLPLFTPIREQTECNNICTPLGFLVPCKRKSLQRPEYHIPREPRGTDGCPELFDVQNSEPRGHTPAPHTLLRCSLHANKPWLQPDYLAAEAGAVMRRFGAWGKGSILFLFFWS